MQNKPLCKNLNHGKSSPAVSHCPNCGERFKGGMTRSCNSEKHRERRKSANAYCCDCGKDLRKD